MTKPILCLDFDGVMHSYTSGWQGATVISDPPVPGLFPFLCSAMDHFRVVVHSSRSHQPGGIYAMHAWLMRHYDNWLREGEGTGVLDVGLLRFPIEEIKFVRDKPPAMVTIDDRAVTFTGQWPRVADLTGFKPWNKAG